MIRKIKLSEKNTLMNKIQKLYYITGSIIFSALILWGVSHFASQIKDILYILCFSGLIAYLLVGLVDWIQHHTFIKKRGLVIFLVYLLLFLIFTVFTLVILPTVITQVSNLAERIPLYFDTLTVWFENIKTQSTLLPFMQNISLDFSAIASQISSLLTGFSTNIAPKILDFAFDTISFFVYFFTTLVLSVYFLLDGHNLWKRLVSPFPTTIKHHLNLLQKNLDKCLRGFFIGQIQLSSLSGLVMFIVYAILGSKYSLLLALSQIILEIIPVIGGIIAIALTCTVLLFNIGWIKALVAFIIYMIYTQLIKDNILAPRIMSNAIDLHPIMVLLVILLGAKLGGIFGIIFALPIAGILNATVNYYIEYKHSNECEAV